jgi:hypothetical protein
MSRHFWPGYRWRILAHERATQGAKPDYTGKRITASSDDHDLPVEFDELVIDHWFHLEQMDTRCWWMGVGGWHINVHIDAAGKPTVTMGQNETPEEVQARAVMANASRRERS